MASSESGLDELLRVVAEADRGVLEIYESGDFGVEHKDDDTPLTRADILAHQILMPGIAAVTPNIPIVSEEGDQNENRRTVKGRELWLVDPIDGTREFIARTGDFTICLARLEDDVPKFGIVSAPAMGVTYFGGPEMGSFKQINGSEPVQISIAVSPLGIVLRSRSLLDPSTAAYIQANFPGHVARAVGSQLKFTEIAEGSADVYPRLQSPLHLWDVAAGHAILAGAGGKVTRIDGSDIDYHSETLNVPDFIAKAH